MRWYLTFSEGWKEEQVGELLGNIRSLDLGHNSLTSQSLSAVPIRHDADMKYSDSKSSNQVITESRIPQSIP